jgi:dihydrofolate reductase
MIALIAAVGTNNVIGKGQELPWRLSTDLKRFATLTKGNIVVMGRKTYASILARLGKPLPDRLNAVISRDEAYHASGARVYHSIENALTELRREFPHQTIFVIGGGEVYRAALPYADRLFITHVHAAPEGDVFFPPYAANEWRPLSSESTKKDEKNQYDTTYTLYERIHHEH